MRLLAFAIPKSIAVRLAELVRRVKTLRDVERDFEHDSRGHSLTALAHLFDEA
jgi:hypothetical protein